MDFKFCRDCGERRPVAQFSASRRSRDGLAFYCRGHLAERSARSREARRTQPARYRSRPRDVVVPEGSKWCPDCGHVKPVTDFPRSRAATTGLASCLPCHNLRGKQNLEKRGGSRTHHLTRRYGITAEEADEMLEAQGGLCAVCRAAPAAHVDHDHATGAARELLCFNCKGGLGQFRDDPAALRAAADYVERHRARQQTAAGEGSAGARPGAPGRSGGPPVGSAPRRRGRSGATRHGAHTSRDSRQQAAGEADT